MRCVGNLAIIGSDNGSAPSHYLNQCKNIVNLTIRNKIQWNLMQIHTFSFKKMHVKTSFAKRQPFCLGLDVSTQTQCSPSQSRFLTGCTYSSNKSKYFKLTGIGWLRFLRSMISRDKHYPWWRHQMETFSALLALCAGNSPVPVISPHKGQWRGALMFLLISAWIIGWVNNRDAGDLRRHRAHYDVIVMPNIIRACMRYWPY